MLRPTDGNFGWSGRVLRSSARASRRPKATPFEFAFGTTRRWAIGDEVPPAGLRIVGPITAISGLLLIGWSVAIIFEVMKMADVQVARKDPSS